VKDSCCEGLPLETEIGDMVKIGDMSGFCKDENTRGFQVQGVIGLPSALISNEER
jgi:hypothetical protein